MTQFMGSLVRSGALCSCGATACIKSRRGFCSRVLRGFVGARWNVPRSSALAGLCSGGEGHGTGHSVFGLP